MKRILIILLTVAAVFTACEGPAGKDGRNGRDGSDAYLEWTTTKVTIARNAWELIGEPDEIGSYYRCLFEFPALTEDIYEEGIIICYYEYQDELGDWVLSPLPYSVYDMYKNDRNQEVQVSINYSYTVSPGYIEFRLAYSDFYTGAFAPPAECFFRASVVY
ncbi:hypothetical protein FACS189464_1070 [Bacteroidia bacterium]|nr:hypothetical protein FACS189464_1070 [Bacteroidia bacterium]